MTPEEALAELKQRLQAAIDNRNDPHAWAEITALYLELQSGDLGRVLSSPIGGREVLAEVNADALALTHGRYRIYPFEGNIEFGSPIEFAEIRGGLLPVRVIVLPAEEAR